MGTTTPAEVDTNIQTLVPVTSQLINKCDTPWDFSQSTDAITPTANTTTYKEGYGTTDNTSLNIGKSGTTEALVYYRDTVSIDMSGTSPYMWCWLHILNSGALAKISNVQLYVRQGANYRYWQTGVASLAVGWNLIKTGVFTSYTGQSGTAPTLSAIDTIELRINTTASSDTFSLGDLKMDFFHWELFANYNIGALTGYPTVSGQVATARYYISSTKALGYDLRECGEFNTDSTPVMYSHDVHNSLGSSGKTSEIELHYILTHTIS